MAKIDHLSWSQVSMYLENPREYWFQYVKYPERTEGKEFHFLIGSAYHKAIEDLYNGVGLIEAIEEYKDTVKSRETAYNFGEIANIENCIKDYAKSILPLYSSLKKTVESDVKDFQIPGVDVPFHLRIDLQLIDDRVIDHKTVGRSEPMAQGHKQLMVYAYYVYKTTGRMPRTVELHKAFKSYPTPVEIDSCDVTTADMLSTIDLIQNVYKMISLDIFPSTGKWWNQTWKAEWDNLIVRTFK